MTYSKLIRAALPALLLFSIQAFAQRPTPDKIATSHGDLVVQPVLHATVVLSGGGKTIYVDPTGGEKALSGLAAPDLILITDIHGDHLNLETLNAMQLEKAVFVVPQAVADMLPPALKSKAVVLTNGQSTDQGGVHIRAIPMYNLPEGPDSKHPKGRGNGYVVELGGKRIYISGDTEDIVEMRALKNIDIAFVCMNEPYTMNINQAAAAVREFRPKIVYPYHYRGKDGLSDVEGFRKLVNSTDPSIEVRLRNWYPQY